MLKTTLKSVVLLSLVAGIYGLTGCTVDDESSSEEEDIKEVTISTDSNTSTITNNDRYDLIVSGSNNTLSLEDNLNEITISGDDNTLTVEEDTQISTITITGDNNYIRDDAVYNVTKIVTTGENNLIEVGTYETWTDTQPEGSTTKNTVNASVSN